MAVYAKATQKKIDALEEKIAKLDKQRRLLERQIEEAKTGESPIKPLDYVTWSSNNRVYRGQVLTVSTSWSGYEYRVCRLSKKGTAIGFANVTSKHNIALEGYEDE